MLDQFAASLREELDFRHEADAMEEMAMLLGARSDVRVPSVYREFCTRRVLVQERFDGWTLADIDQLDAAGLDRDALAEQLLRTTIDQVLGVGFFHADPHPGNVFAFPDGTLGLIDFGAVGRLDPIQQAAVVDILAALVRRDVSLLRDGIERVADLTETVSPDRLERALARLMADHLKPSGAVDPAVLQDLIALLTQFGVRLPGRARDPVARARDARRDAPRARTRLVARHRDQRDHAVAERAATRWRRKRCSATNCSRRCRSCAACRIASTASSR